jgi:signal transduction histidine kinase
VQILGPAGDVVAASPQLAGRPPMARLAVGESRTVDLPFDDDSYLVVAASAGSRTVLLARSGGDVAEATQALTVLLGVGLPLLLLVVGATTWRLVGGALAPVDAIRAEVDAISAAALHRRVPLPATRDEIDRLAATMNRMLDRLERVRVRERGFIADASHELRSPIAAIRQHAEVALAHPDRTSTADLARVAHAESLRMQALVDDLLLLARADEEGLRRSRVPVDLDDLVFAEGVRLRGEAAVTLDTSAVSPVRVEGDPAGLGRMLRNLVDNAARHAAGRVALALAERDGRAVIHVDDDGPGIPLADRKRVFDRFVRLDESRSRAVGGSGLGLAIVAEIVAAHGGDVAVVDGPLGGARFTVRLPVRAPS